MILFLIKKFVTLIIVKIKVAFVVAQIVSLAGLATILTEGVSGVSTTMVAFAVTCGQPLAEATVFVTV